MKTFNKNLFYSIAERNSFRIENDLTSNLNKHNEDKVISFLNKLNKDILLFSTTDSKYQSDINKSSFDNLLEIYNNLNCKFNTEYLKVF
jgi:hypothetical protein